MSCCAPGAELALEAVDFSRARDAEVLLSSRTLADGLRQTYMASPAIHCGACIEAIERGLRALPGVEAARVNLSTMRVSVCWRGATPPPLLETMRALGYEAHLFEAGADDTDAALAGLVRALAVAGFAAGNIMLLSVSVWSGADPSTRNLFHRVSALIAVPAIAYAGRVFFRPAWQSLRRGRTNMDVPISVGVLLATAMSLYETLRNGEHAYFDASVSLLFFLLVGRTLDHLMRARARTAVTGLARLSPHGAMVVNPDSTRDYLPVDEIGPGMTILLAVGERVPVDARPGGRVRYRRVARHRRKRAGGGRARLRDPGWHAQPDAAADNRRRGRCKGLVPCGNAAPDGGGGGRQVSLSAHRRQGGAPLCAGRPSDRVRRLARVACRGR